MSLVDGYDLPMAITNNVNCPVASCTVDLGPICRSSRLPRFALLTSGQVHNLYRDRLTAPGSQLAASRPALRTLMAILVRPTQSQGYLREAHQLTTMRHSQFSKLLLWELRHTSGMPSVECSIL